MAFLLYVFLFAFLAIHSRVDSMAPLVPFTNVLQNYPTTTNQQFLTDAKLSSKLSGPFDSLRVSDALFKSGYAITIGDEQFGWSRTVTTDCARYIANIDTMEKYLTAKVGNPIVSSSESAFQGKTGIMIFKTCSNPQNQHVDLYDGTGCKGQCKFNGCTVIQLFQVSQ